MHISAVFSFQKLNKSGNVMWVGHLHRVRAGNTPGCVQFCIPGWSDMWGLQFGQDYNRRKRF